MRTCRCGRQLDKFGHHRAACAVAGVLGRRGYPLEVAAAQVCREAGARVSTNLHVRDMDLAEFNNLDGRRLEVVADGLTLWHGAQLAIDTTLVSPLRRDGSPRPRAADHSGAALDDACRRKDRTYPELSGDGGRARLVVLAAEVGGRWSVETANFLVSLAKAKALDSPYCRAGFSRPSSGGGVLFWLAQHSAPSLLRCWTAAQCWVSGSSHQCMMGCVMQGLSEKGLSVQIFR